MDLKIPDVSKLAWQLNLAIIAAIFSVISLIYNEKYIHYGFITFLFAVISHFVSTWFEFVYAGDQLRNKRQRFYIIQSILIVAWIVVLLIIR